MARVFGLSTTQKSYGEGEDHDFLPSLSWFSLSVYNTRIGLVNATWLARKTLP